MDNIWHKITQFWENKAGKLTLAAIAVAFLVAFIVVQPNFIQGNISKGEFTMSRVEAKEGNISIQSGKSGEKQNTVLIVSAAGSRGQSFSPWVKTGVEVTTKDKVKIEASGSVYTAMARLIDVSTKDYTSNNQTWVGPEGTSVPNNEWDSKRESLKLVPARPYGALVAAVLDNDKKVRNQGSIDKFEVKTNGELVLAVNDILLNGGQKDLYAFPIEKNKIYYDHKLDQENPQAKSWPAEKREIEAKKIYEKRLKTWNTEIDRKSDFTVWFEDNVGNFFVSITKIQA